MKTSTFFLSRKQQKIGTFKEHENISQPPAQQQMCQFTK